MARKSQQTILKRQREQKKAEKAFQKRARRDARKDTETPFPGEGSVLPIEQRLAVDRRGETSA